MIEATQATVTATSLLTLHLTRRDYRLIDIDSASRIVFAETHRDFATWKYADDGSLYWGHYFPKHNAGAELQARHDFNQRRGAA